MAGILHYTHQHWNCTQVISKCILNDILQRCGLVHPIRHVSPKRWASFITGNVTPLRSTPQRGMWHLRYLSHTTTRNSQSRLAAVWEEQTIIIFFLYTRAFSRLLTISRFWFRSRGGGGEIFSLYEDAKMTTRNINSFILQRSLRTGGGSWRRKAKGPQGKNKSPFERKKKKKTPLGFPV